MKEYLFGLRGFAYMRYLCIDNEDKVTFEHRHPDGKKCYQPLHKSINILDLAECLSMLYDCKLCTLSPSYITSELSNNDSCKNVTTVRDNLLYISRHRECKEIVYCIHIRCDSGRFWTECFSNHDIKNLICRVSSHISEGL